MCFFWLVTFFRVLYVMIYFSNSIFNQEKYRYLKK